MHRLIEVDDLARRMQALPDEVLKDLVLRVVGQRTKSMSPADGLKFLFQLDADLYPLMGELSVAYDGGTHTKHRHTKYHDFFIKRIKPDERVLDVGCGIGFLSFDIAEKAGAFVVGVDLEERNIEIAKARFAASECQLRASRYSNHQNGRIIRRRSLVKRFWSTFQIGRNS